MPVASVYKDHSAKPRKHEVWTAWQLFVVEPITKAESMKF
jgi:hypothetical protein